MSKDIEIFMIQEGAVEGERRSQQTLIKYSDLESVVNGEESEHFSQSPNS